MRDSTLVHERATHRAPDPTLCAYAWQGVTLMPSALSIVLVAITEQ